MKLQVDLREPAVLKEAFENCELLNLDLGDIVIRDNNNIILAIFERKSINDLLASVKDLRYSEQSDRLSKLDLSNNCIYYIIEGNRYNYTGTCEKTIYSCIYSLSYKKGFSVLLSNNIQDTIKIIKEFSSRIELNKHDKKETNLIKKDKVSKENINSAMLSTIPGIGINTAKQILTHFDNDLVILINKLKVDINCMDLIKVNNRKVNKKILENIKEYLIH